MPVRGRYVSTGMIVITHNHLLMSYFNRSYGRGSGFLSSMMAGAPAVKAILLTNIGVFLFEMLFGTLRIGGIPIEGYIKYFLYLWPPGSDYFYPWQFVSYMFLHGGFSHIFFNMLALVIFGPTLETTWGSKKFLIYYFLCGLGGGLAHSLISPMIAGGAGPLVGASGAIFGLLAAFGLMFPDQMLLVFFFVPMKAKYAVLFFIMFEVFSVKANDGVGHLAHLGGAVVGITYLLIEGSAVNPFKRRGPRNDSPWQPPRNGGFAGKRFGTSDDDMMDAEYHDIGATKTYGSSTNTATRVITQEDIDRILDKIAASGYQNLTSEEHEILKEASRKANERK